MRFLVVNHLRLGAMPGDLPAHAGNDLSAHSTRSSWQRAIDYALRSNVHAVFLTGEIIATSNPGLEPIGPLIDGIIRLQEAHIPVVALADGRFTPDMAQRFHLNDAVQFLDDRLEWDPPIVVGREAGAGPCVHVIAARLAESTNAPVERPITLAEIDEPQSVWILTDALLPDIFRGEHALVIEPGAIAPLTPNETGSHGGWLVDTEAFDATLVPLASLEYAAIAIDMQPAQHVEDVERIIAQALIAAADDIGADAGVTTLVVHCTLTGATQLYPALADIGNDLQRTLMLEHAGITIVISHIDNDAMPTIDLTQLLGRPDPVGEIARLLQALSTGEELSPAHARLAGEVEQKLLAVTHSRVFGAIIDTPLSTDAHTLLQRQAWATLDTMVRQRGID